MGWEVVFTPWLLLSLAFFRSGRASAFKTQSVGVKITVVEGEPIANSVARFRKAVSRESPTYIKRVVHELVTKGEKRRQKGRTKKLRARLMEMRRRWGM